MRQDMVKMVETVNKINMKPEMEEDILKNLKKMAAEEKIDRKYMDQFTDWDTEKRRGGLLSNSAWQKFAVAAACVLAVGLAAVPVKAFVESVVRERMEQIPEKELIDTVDMLEENSRISKDIDGFSRGFTESEDARMKELAREYNQGRFPSETMAEVENDMAALSDTICYSVETSTYFLPERELTDEELLQYLDYQQKLNYALQENAKKEQEVQEAQAIEPLSAGEFSLEEAEAVGEELMGAVFKEDTEGFEKNSYLFYTGKEEPEEVFALDTIKYKSQYMVNYTVIHDYYYFYIDAATGNVAQASHNYSAPEKEKMLPEEAEALLVENKEAAEKILREGFGKTDDISHIYSSYIINQEGAVENGELGFHFVTEDGTDYILVLDGRTKELVEYRDTYYEEYIKARDEYENYLKDRYGDSDMKLPVGERITAKMQ